MDTPSRFSVISIAKQNKCTAVRVYVRHGVQFLFPPKEENDTFTACLSVCLLFVFLSDYRRYSIIEDTNFNEILHSRLKP